MYSKDCVQSLLSNQVGVATAVGESFVCYIFVFNILVRQVIGIRRSEGWKLYSSSSVNAPVRRALSSSRREGSKPSNSLVNVGIDSGKSDECSSPFRRHFLPRTFYSKFEILRVLLSEI